MKGDKHPSCARKLAPTQAIPPTPQMPMDELVRQAALLDQVSDAIIATDLNLRITSWNAAAERIYGWRATEVLGQDMDELLSSTFLHETQKQAQATLLKAGAWKGFLRQRNRAGDPLVVEASVAWVHNAHGARVGGVTINRDMTAQQLAEQESKRLLRELQRRDEILSGVNLAARSMLEQGAPRAVENALRFIGEGAHAQRAYIFENHLLPDGRLATSQRYEWSHPSVTRQLDNPALQNIPYEAAGFGRWQQELQAGRYVAKPIRTLPANERELLHGQGILAIAIVPIFVEGSWWGFIGFDDCQCERQWNSSELEALQTAARLFAAFITQSRHTQALTQSEARLKLALEVAQMGYWRMDCATYKVEWSSGHEKLFGIPLDAFGGTLDAVQQSVHPDDRAHGEANLRKTLEQHAPFDNTYRVVHPDGSLHWLHSYGILYHDAQGAPSHIFGVTQDITEIKQAEAAMQESERKYRDLFENFPVGLYQTTLDGRIIEANQMCLEIAHCPPERRAEWFAQDTRQSYVDPEDSARLRDRIRKEGMVRGFEARIRRYDGKVAWLNNSARLVRDAQGKPVAISGSFVDVTDRVLAEQRAEAQRAQLQQAEKMAALGTLVAGVAHEINNPNNYIMLNIPLIREAWESVTPIINDFFQNNGDFLVAGINYSEMRDYLPRLMDAAEKGAARIQSIVKNLKEHSRVDEYELNERVDVNEVLQCTADMMKSCIGAKTDNFTLRLHDTPLWVKGNARRLEQVLTNLIQNACDALAHRQQAIRVETFKDPSGQAGVRVADEGVGIPAENLPRIGNPFFTTKQAQGGTGLGLSISLAIVQDHKGTLAFTSEPGQGTVAQLLLPALHDQQQAGAHD